MDGWSDPWWVDDGGWRAAEQSSVVNVVSQFKISNCQDTVMGLTHHIISYRDTMHHIHNAHP